MKDICIQTCDVTLFCDFTWKREDKTALNESSIEIITVIVKRNCYLNVYLFIFTNSALIALWGRHIKAIIIT